MPVKVKQVNDNLFSDTRPTKGHQSKNILNTRAMIREFWGWNQNVEHQIKYFGTKAKAG